MPDVAWGGLFAVLAAVVAASDTLVTQWIAARGETLSLKEESSRLRHERVLRQRQETIASLRLYVRNRALHHDAEWMRYGLRHTPAEGEAAEASAMRILKEIIETDLASQNEAALRSQISSAPMLRAFDELVVADDVYTKALTSILDRLEAMFPEDGQSDTTVPSLPRYPERA